MGSFHDPARSELLETRKAIVGGWLQIADKLDLKMAVLGNEAFRTWDRDTLRAVALACRCHRRFGARDLPARHAAEAAYHEWQPTTPETGPVWLTHFRHSTALMCID